jgi:hypothetical protein
LLADLIMLLCTVTQPTSVIITGIMLLLISIMFTLQVR